MQIVGLEPLTAVDDAVHTIDLWYSEARRRWGVQRHGFHGEPIGLPHFCRTQAEAKACLGDWLRRHPEAHLAAAHQPAARRTAMGSRPVTRGKTPPSPAGE